MRIRALKPGFFKNEDLCELSPWHRLCFAGLWCYADRDGRMLDRPKRLKAEIFPYDDLDMNFLLWDLSRAGFIKRYAVNGTPLIWIPTWDAHQRPRQDEAQSDLAAYSPGTERLGGPDTTTFPAVRAVDLVEHPALPVSIPDIVTDPSLCSDEPVTTARMGKGKGSGNGNGDWDLGGGKGSSVADAPPHVRAQDLIDLWNATTTPPIPRCRELNDERRRKIRSRLAKRPSLADWREAFEYLNARPFYRGQNERQWVADFDWTIKNDTVIAKVLDRAKTEPPSSAVSPQGHSNAVVMARVAAKYREQG